MKLRLFSTLLMLFSTFTFAQDGPPFTLPASKPLSVIEKAHAATLEIGQQTITGTKVCSAVAIGPHALATVSHCELPTDDLVIAGKDKPATIVGRIRDGFDHSIYLLDGVTFSDFATIKLTPLNQGDEFFIFGNPAEFEDQYRKGYVTGYTGNENEVLFQIDAYHGDSGAGLFNSKGEVIGLFSEVVLRQSNGAQIQFGGGFQLQFKQADLDRARAFGEK